MSPTSDKALTDALIALCGLSTEAIERITESMRSTHSSFTDTALHLGVVSPEDIEDAVAWARSHAASPSLIETAIRQAQGQNRVTVRQGGVVRPGSQITLMQDPDNPRSERIRALRTELMLLAETLNRGNVYALLSPGPAEGRSQLCAELAIAFAQLGRRTLLVDADMRHPRQHVLFNADNNWGLAQALSLGEAPAVYGVEGVPELSLLTAGVIPPNPLELISHRRFERLLEDWRRNYDFVLIDTPPVSQCADALAIATVAGRVLVISRKKATSFSGMKDMLRRLAPTQAKILGAVINSF